ncbi:MAG: hypothetical protein ACK53L_25745, partial [Pirellulaceae bacterium]
MKVGIGKIISAIGRTGTGTSPFHIDWIRAIKLRAEDALRPTCRAPTAGRIPPHYSRRTSPAGTVTPRGYFRRARRYLPTRWTTA